jgi:hypothetical protein
MSTADLPASAASPAQRPRPTPRLAVLPDVERAAVEIKRATWLAESIEAGGYEAWVAGQFLVQTERLDHCHATENVIRAHEALRATLDWDGDRELDAVLLGDKLSRKPALYARLLRETPHGCIYLAERWEMLAKVLHVRGGWTEDQESLALDMLGVPWEVRGASSILDPAPGADALAHRKTFCRNEIKSLKNRARSIAPLDARARESASAGSTLHSSQAIKTNQRYERECMKRLQWAIAELTRLRAWRSPDRVEPAPPPPPPKRPVPTDPAPQAQAVSPTPIAPTPAAPSFRDEPICLDTLSGSPARENRRARRARMKRDRSQS